MNVPQEPILKSEKWRWIFFRAFRGRMGATHLYALPSGMAARNWNWTPLFKILDPPLL